MTRVDFYIISDANPQAEDTVACRLTEKALKQGYKILILGQSKKQLQSLDEKLWTYNDQSFIPHEIINELANTDDRHNEHLKVILSDNEQAGNSANLLINLSGKVPEHYSNFERIAEIVPAQEQERQQSRVRFKEYKKRQCELQTHNL